MPPHSCAVPGRKPGTSSNVMSGMLKQSQKRMKRAILFDASTSRQPASTIGLFATMPTVRPPMRAKPTTALRAKLAWTSKKLSRSTAASTIVCTS